MRRTGTLQTGGLIAKGYLMARMVDGRRRGASGLSYALAIGLVAVIAITATQSVGISVNALFGRVTNSMQAARDGQSTDPATVPPQPSAEPTVEGCSFDGQTIDFPRSGESFESDILLALGGCDQVAVVMVGGGGGSGASVENNRSGQEGGDGDVLTLTLSGISGDTLQIAVGRGGLGGRRNGTADQSATGSQFCRISGRRKGCQSTTGSARRSASA